MGVFEVDSQDTGASIDPPQRRALADVVDHLRAAARISPDRRRHARVNVRVFGRFMLADKREYPCQVINMSPGGIAMLSPIEGEPGERVVAYLDNLGRVEGEIVRPIAGGFAMRINATPHKREKIANLLTWMANQKELGLPDERRHARVAPRNPFSHLILPDGAVQECRVLDVSLSGASIAMANADRPPVGTPVKLGRMNGVIVRHHDQGIGVKFTTELDEEGLAQEL